VRKCLGGARSFLLNGVKQAAGGRRGRGGYGMYGRATLWVEEGDEAAEACRALAGAAGEVPRSNERTSRDARAQVEDRLWSFSSR